LRRNQVDKNKQLEMKIAALLGHKKALRYLDSDAWAWRLLLRMGTTAQLVGMPDTNTWCCFAVARLPGPEDRVHAVHPCERESANAREAVCRTFMMWESLRQGLARPEDFDNVEE